MLMYWLQEGSSDEWMSSHHIDEVLCPVNGCGMPKIEEMGDALIGKRWYRGERVAEFGE